MVRDFSKTEEHIIEYLDHPQFDHVLGKVSIPWVRRCRDTEPCDIQESIERYVWAHIFCMLGTVVFPDKSTTSLNSKFLPLFRDFYRISAYSWGAASLAHLYRSLCRASRYNCKEMDGPPILLFVWAWERMPFLTPIPRDQLVDVSIQLAQRWCHWRRHTRYTRRPIERFRRALDDMEFDDGEIYSEWVNRWRFDRYNTLQLGEEIIDFHPLLVYYEWYTQHICPAVSGSGICPSGSASGICPAVAGISAQAAYIPETQSPQAPESYIPKLVIPAEGHFSPLGGSDTINFSQVLRDIDFLSPPPPQEGPTTSQHSGGRRATSGHAGDFDFDDPMGHVDPSGPSALPRGQLFDLNEYPQQEEGDLGYDLQHYGLDTGVSQGHPYNLRTQTAPPDKYTPSLYAKKVPRK
ncbi:hypothetical protein Ahy_A08g039448 [Arachis hypogaea]|uniref:Aminotransferase-like plant mobile domain-containing protein n=1 Tax=Arachis hypogaea TaxID=3818 RepID=A0A445BWS3_ARAHY|nr:hypothetical protein Ahy_A08g039448 [Arachis hypogaea]